jgi:hypothetical protein
MRFDTIWLAHSKIQSPYLAVYLFSEDMERPVLEQRILMLLLDRSKICANVYANNLPMDVNREVKTERKELGRTNATHPDRLDSNSRLN